MKEWVYCLGVLFFSKQPVSESSAHKLAFTQNGLIYSSRLFCEASITIIPDLKMIKPRLTKVFRSQPVGGRVKI